MPEPDKPAADPFQPFDPGAGGPRAARLDGADDLGTVRDLIHAAQRAAAHYGAAAPETPEVLRTLNAAISAARACFDSRLLGLQRAHTPAAAALDPTRALQEANRRLRRELASERDARARAGSMSDQWRTRCINLKILLDLAYQDLAIARGEQPADEADAPWAARDPAEISRALDALRADVDQLARSSPYHYDLSETGQIRVYAEQHDPDRDPPDLVIGVDPRCDGPGAVVVASRRPDGDYFELIGFRDSAVTSHGKNDGSTTSGAGTIGDGADGDAAGPGGQALAPPPEAEAEELAGHAGADEPAGLVPGAAAPTGTAGDRGRGLRARLSGQRRRQQRETH